MNNGREKNVQPQAAGQQQVCDHVISRTGTVCAVFINADRVYTLDKGSMEATSLIEEVKKRRNTKNDNQK